MYFGTVAGRKDAPPTGNKEKYAGLACERLYKSKECARGTGVSRFKGIRHSLGNLASLQGI